MPGFIELDEIDYNCHDDHDGTIAVVAVSPLGDKSNIYDVECAEDTWRNEGVYDNRRLVGTHWLSDNTLRALFPDDDLGVYTPERFVVDCRQGPQSAARQLIHDRLLRLTRPVGGDTCTSPAPALVVGIKPAGEFLLLCLGCAEDVLEFPDEDDNRGVTLHGTHILADTILHELFPADFDDDDDQTEA